MASEVGVAYVSIVPSTRGFAAGLNRQIAPPVQKTGVTTGKRFGSAFGLGFKALGGGLLAGVGLGALVKGAASAEASFSQTMNTMAAVAKVPQSQIKILSDLALQLGKDTIFSAGEAADAMLELAKGGITPAQIQAGALRQTLTLAAASGEDLGTSATILANAMNTFQLSAKDAPKITAALAGAANASTASIGSLGEALQQVGPGALNAGLSVQETVAALAAFDSAGIKGSDAGTSLKTMLARLVPQTDKAQNKMDELGLTFTDANGNIVPLIKIAGRLKKALGGLNQGDRISALNRIFGSDASRAASVLATVGVKGLEKYITATKDQSAAQEVADARMKGTAGTLERLRGSFETAKLTIGQAIAPAVQAGANLAAKALNALTDKVPGWIAALRDPFGTFQTEILPKLQSFYDYIKNTLVPGLRNFAQKVLPSVIDTVKGVADSVGDILDTFKTRQGDVSSVNVTFATLKTAAALLNAELKIVKTNVQVLATAFKIFTFVPRTLAGVAIQIISFFTKPIIASFGFIVHAAATAFGWVPGIGPKLKNAAAKFDAFKAQVSAALSGFGAIGFQIGADFAANLAAGIAGRGKVSQSAALGTANKLASGLRSGKLIEGVRANSVSAGDSGAGDIIVNNPVPEPASESVDKALRRKRRQAGWSAG